MPTCCFFALAQLPPSPLLSLRLPATVGAVADCKVGASAISLDAAVGALSDTVALCSCLWPMRSATAAADCATGAVSSTTCAAAAGVLQVQALLQVQRAH
jgi:hypothetical protein